MLKQYVLRIISDKARHNKRHELDKKQFAFLLNENHTET